MLAQPVHPARIKRHTRTKSKTTRFPFTRLLVWALFLLLVGALEMLLLTSAARLAEATVPPVIRDTRSHLTADYSPWEPTRFQPVKPSIMQAFADGSGHVWEPSNDTDVQLVQEGMSR